MARTGSISVMLVRPLAAVVPPGERASLFGAADLTPELLADDDARISAPQFCVAWAEAIRATADPALALAMATAIPIGAFGIVEYVCRAAPTVGEALQRWVRYLNLLDDAVRVGLAIDDDHAYLRVELESEAPAPASHELCFALVVKQLRQLSAAPFRATRVELTHRAPADVATYRAWFDAPVVFDADTTQLVMPRAALAASLRSSDPALLAILTRAADDLARAAPREPPFLAQVKRAVRELLRGNDATIEQVAKQLGLTTRSLQRRLKDAGTSFQAVREAVRRELATRYLDDQLSIAEISFLLGFSEPSAFFRAFKRWTGTTPLAARRLGPA
jgi:AraC-like DNA-binding protein